MFRLTKILAAAALAGSIATAPALAENAQPYSGMQVIDTTLPFEPFRQQLLQAIKANKMGVVANACGSCGAKSIGVTIPGNQIIMVFRPDYAVRMLKASVAAGIEAPLRLYLTEQADGKARLTYRLPSHVFGAYEVPALDEMAAELDGMLAKIVKDALGK
jgi:uncharacterized protein (DUF302 family)